MSSKWVRVGSVRRFDEVKASREQVVKMAEEVMEVFSAWEDFWKMCERDEEGNPVFGIPFTDAWIEPLLDECADVIQATLNLVSALGVEDFRPYMKECERRNKERGRITDGKVVDDAD